MDEQQVRKIIQEELQSLLGTDRYTFQKHLQIFDGRNIQFGRTTGNNLGTATDQKVAFYGVTPVVQAGAITTPTAPGAIYDQTEMASLKTAIDAIRTAIKNLGITA